MKSFFAFFFAAFLAGSVLAQDHILQQPPPSVQTDTTSGWKVVFSNPRYHIGNLQYFPENTVYALAYNGSIILLMKSFDGGITWDTLTTPVPDANLTFTSPSVGYSADGPSFKNVWKTTDGGQSWVAHPRNSVSYGPVVFANLDTGVVFSSSTIARTTDAGNTWKEVSPAAGLAPVSAGAFGSSQIGYGVGSKVLYPPNVSLPMAGYCEKTKDGGATWDQIYTGIPDYLWCCYAIGPNILIVGGGSGWIGRTTNGGGTWDSILIGDKYSLYNSISFADSLHGMIVGAKNNQEGIVLGTSDGGKTWQTLYVGFNSDLNQVCMINDSIAIMTDDGNIYRTTNGGKASVDQTSTLFNLQLFPDPAQNIINIQYQLPSPLLVSCQIHNVEGIQVGALNLGIQNMGTQQTAFDCSALPNGAYYVSLTAGLNQQTVSFAIQK